MSAPTTSAPPAPGSGTCVTTTTVTRLRERALRTPDRVALREKDFGVWHEITWAEYWEWVQRFAHGLLALGVTRGDRVAIHSENRAEWFFADQAIVAIGAVTVGLYPTNPADEVQHMLSDCNARVLFAEDQEQVDKALEVHSDLPELTHIVYVEPQGVLGAYDHPRLLFLDDFLAKGDQHRKSDPGGIDQAISMAQSTDTMTLIYTSGTTGPPKGAMLSIANVEFTIQSLVVDGGFCWPPPSDKDLVVSYLPLCHAAERIFSLWFNVVAGVEVNFAESIETVEQNLAEVQPTLLFGVPRIWEKILAGIDIKSKNATPLKRLNYRIWMFLARRIGRELVKRRGNWTTALRLQYAIGWLFLFRSLRKHIGASNVRYAMTGAAPIAPDVLEFFLGIGLPMHEAWGMTENSAVGTATKPGHVVVGTVGEAHQGVEIRLDQTTGEILTRSDGTFQGYWGRAKATKDIVDSEGWLHTGDVGEWVDDRYLRITGRMKDIIITSGGKNITPSEIENALKASPYVKEAMVIGDGRKYLTALIGIELDTVGDWAQRERLPYTTYRDLSEKPEVLQLVRGVVRAANDRFARVEQIKKFRMLPKELDHEDGELTATQKVKRSAVIAMFNEHVESMYGGQSVGAGMEV